MGSYIIFPMISFANMNLYCFFLKHVGVLFFYYCTTGGKLRHAVHNPGKVQSKENHSEGIWIGGKLLYQHTYLIEKTLLYSLQRLFTLKLKVQKVKI